MVTYRLDSQSVNFLLDCQEYLNTLNPLIRDTFYESVTNSSLTCYYLFPFLRDNQVYEVRHRVCCQCNSCNR